jgi:hypothetical protein
VTSPAGSRTRRPALGAGRGGQVRLGLHVVVEVVRVHVGRHGAAVAVPASRNARSQCPYRLPARLTALEAEMIPSSAAIVGPAQQPMPTRPAAMPPSTPRGWPARRGCTTRWPHRQQGSRAGSPPWTTPSPLRWQVGGVPVSAVLAVALAVIAAGVFLSVPAARSVLILAVVVAAVIWAGQGFGGIFTGSGTDPNSGPLLALLAAAYWPRRARAPGQAGRWCGGLSAQSEPFHAVGQESVGGAGFDRRYRSRRWSASGSTARPGSGARSGARCTTRSAGEPSIPTAGTSSAPTVPPNSTRACSSCRLSVSCRPATSGWHAGGTEGRSAI